MVRGGTAFSKSCMKEDSLECTNWCLFSDGSLFSLFTSDWFLREPCIFKLNDSTNRYDPCYKMEKIPFKKITFNITRPVKGGAWKPH